MLPVQTLHCIDELAKQLLPELQKGTYAAAKRLARDFVRQHSGKPRETGGLFIGNPETFSGMIDRLSGNACCALFPELSDVRGVMTPSVLKSLLNLLARIPAFVEGKQAPAEDLSSEMTKLVRDYLECRGERVPDNGEPVINSALDIATAIRRIVESHAAMERFRQQVRKWSRQHEARNEAVELFAESNGEWAAPQADERDFRPPTLAMRYAQAAALHDACRKAFWRRGPLINPWRRARQIVDRQGIPFRVAVEKLLRRRSGACDLAVERIWLPFMSDALRMIRRDLARHGIDVGPLADSPETALGRSRGNGRLGRPHDPKVLERNSIIRTICRERRLQGRPSELARVVNKDKDFLRLGMAPVTPDVVYKAVRKRRQKSTN